MRKFILILIMFTGVSAPALTLAQIEGAPESFAIVYEAGERRDPFLPLIDSDGKVKFSFNTSDIVIEGIVYDPGKESLVLINGDFYKENDTFENSKVLKIFEDRILLEQENEQKELRIRDELVDKNIT